MYVGAAWCTSTGGPGPGWCEPGECLVDETGQLGNSTSHAAKLGRQLKRQLGRLWQGITGLQPNTTDRHGIPFKLVGPEFTWGTLEQQTDDTHMVAAPMNACAGCGAAVEEEARACMRQLNTLDPRCADLTANSAGLPWRDSWGYSCAAYHHGGFCRKLPSGQWVQGGLWRKEYGPLVDFAWYAMMADGATRRVDATTACCTCGGGTMTTGAVDTNR